MNAPESSAAALDADPASSMAVNASYAVPAPVSASTGISTASPQSTVPTTPIPAPERDRNGGNPPIAMMAPAMTDGKRRDETNQEDDI
jgi:hypothetical protein